MFCFLKLENRIFSVEEKMENISENILSITDINPKTWDFSNFCSHLHDSIGCQKKGCELKIYCDIWPAFLEKVDKTDGEKRLTYISQWKNFSRYFHPCTNST